jgi:hypothetical protein
MHERLSPCIRSILLPFYPLASDPAISESESSLFNRLRRHFRVSETVGVRRFERKRALSGRREPQFLGAGRDGAGSEAVVAVELAHDPDDAVDRLKVRPAHRAIRHEQRLAEAADLQRDELGWRLRHAPGEDLPNEVADALKR